MKAVSKEAFFKVMNPLNVHPHPRGNWPYTSYWELRNRKLVGKTIPAEKYPHENKYYLI